MKRPLFLSVAFVTAWAGYGTTQGPGGLYTGHGEPADFQVPPAGDEKSDAFPSSFNRHRILSQAYFTNSGIVGLAAVQRFLEETPYGKRCWLADEWIGDKTASQAIVDVAVEKGLNPIVLLVRMQVEQSLISKVERPGQFKVDFAFGCGCLDGQDCDEYFRGLDRQLACAADVLVTAQQASLDGTGRWRAGKATTSLDGIGVTPYNHATAALYQYTPWVLPGEGGNWLVWNVTRKFSRHFHDLGLLDLSDPLLDDPWVGRPCADHDDCLFNKGSLTGFCYVFTPDGGSEAKGFCSLPCEGYCPDLEGHATTFCASVDHVNGFCTVYALDQNQYCEEIPGLTAVEADRFVGSSSAAPKQATVCMPL